MLLSYLALKVGPHREGAAMMRYTHALSFIHGVARFEGHGAYFQISFQYITLRPEKKVLKSYLFRFA